MHRKLFALAITAFIASTLSLSGCGPKTVPVSGKIVVDGQPAANIRVVFQSASKEAIVPPTATGLTNENGEYSLSIAGKKKRGAVPGPYVVYLTWSDPNADPNPIEGVTVANESPYKLPPRANSGELRYEVPAKGAKDADFTFDSSSEPTNVAPGV